MSWETKSIERQREYVDDTRAWVKSKLNVLDTAKVECSRSADESGNPLEVNVIAGTVQPYFGNDDNGYFVMAGCKERIDGDFCKDGEKCKYAKDNKTLKDNLFPTLDTNGQNPLGKDFFYYLETRSIVHPDARRPFWEGLV